MPKEELVIGTIGFSAQEVSLRRDFSLSLVFGLLFYILSLILHGLAM